MTVRAERKRTTFEGPPTTDPLLRSVDLVTRSLSTDSGALVAASAGRGVVLAGDTVIALGRRVLGKAENEPELRRMLGLLSGRRHHCLTAVCVIDAAGKARTRLSDTIVAFKPLNGAEIDAYVASGEGLGKAGGYAIQGRAEAFVRFLSGSHSGVIGLPLFETRALLAAAGMPLG